MADDGWLEDSGIGAVATDPDCSVSVRVVAHLPQPGRHGEAPASDGWRMVEDQ